MTIFASDNVTPACPEVMEAINQANIGNIESYGHDKWSKVLDNKFSELFEKDVKVFTAVTGTAANSLALSSITPSYGNIYCHKISHINVDECGAPEFFTGGAKLITIDGDDGKFNSDELKKNIRGSGVVHNTQPASVSITQSCETGVTYKLDEILKINQVAKENGMKIHMDGARFSNAIASLKKSPAEATWKLGIDVLTFGGTKNGCMDAEAIIFFNPSDVNNFQYLQKRSGQLLSKTRFLSSQLDAYITDGLWLRNATHANDMARKLSEKLSKINSFELTYPTESNEIFIKMPKNIQDHLNNEGYSAIPDDMFDGSVRFVTAWNTNLNDIENLINTIKEKL
tara:strand:+ start:2548 stop:3573 length:1026 start_codon:yes stop_codon:yes gene_type:complete